MECGRSERAGAEGRGPQAQWSNGHTDGGRRGGGWARCSPGAARRDRCPKKMMAAGPRRTVHIRWFITRCDLNKIGQVWQRGAQIYRSYRDREVQRSGCEAREARQSSERVRPIPPIAPRRPARPAPSRLPPLLCVLTGFSSLRCRSAASPPLPMSGADFSLTTFSPSGKLVQIEYALNAVNAGKTSLGIKGQRREEKRREGADLPAKVLAPRARRGSAGRRC